MRAEQLAHKFWLQLDAPKGKVVQASIEGASVTAQIQNHDAFSCTAENLSVSLEVGIGWDELICRCEKGLKAFNRDFILLERDDEGRKAIFRSPVSRNLYWEALLSFERAANLTVQRYQPQERGERIRVPFVLTEEQLAEMLAALLES